MMIVAQLVLIAGVVQAQELPPPAMMVKMGEKSEPIKLARVAVDAKIHGYVAETTMTMTFYNPHSRQMAGDLYFPLPEGATISGYALDINGVMVDGVVVAKDRARQVFEIEVRKGIDPGLVEWVKGNNFKTRVFPIPPEGTRTVMVRYLSELVYDEGGPVYHLPMNFRDPVDVLSVRVEVIKSETKPVVKKGSLANFSFEKWRDSYVAEVELKGGKLTDDMAVAIPDVNKQNVVVEKAPDGEYYFYVNDVPPLIGGTASTKGVPKQITILWDASASRGLNNHDRELVLVEKYLWQLNADKVTVNLILFRNDIEKARRFVVEKGDTGELLAALKSVQYDGGTQMGVIAPTKSGDTPDFYLLFSDGISNFGKEQPGEFDAPVYIFSADPTTNHAFLRHLALSSGGAYFNLARHTDDAVLPQIGATPYSFLSARVDDGKVEGRYPSVMQPVQGRFVLVGKLKSAEAKLVLRYGFKGRELHERPVTISRAGAATGRMIRFFWAQKKVDELLMMPEKNKDELVVVGRDFGLVTPGTSLLVLETLDQYVEHKIPPPESLPKMRKEFYQAMHDLDRQEKERVEEKLDRVAGLWEGRVEWWNTKFEIPKKPVMSPKKKTAARVMAGAASREEEAMDGAVGYGSGGSAAGVGVARPGPADAKKDKKPGADAPPPEPSISIKAWDPDTPYLKALKTVTAKKYFSTYMAEREEHGTSPAFFLDCADFFFKKGKDRLALQVLSNIVELELENPALLRVVGYRLVQAEKLDLARQLFEEVKRLRPEEPQSYRDLALVLDRLERFPEALTLMYKVITEEWDRFEEIELPALMELNRIHARAKRSGSKGLPEMDGRVLKLLDVDVRIVFTWDTDLTDMDLWVTEPTGEKADYSNNRTQIGGLVSRDFTQGYGPEEYLLKKSMRGKYKLEVNYYGSSAPTLTGSVTLMVDVFTNYGRKNEKRQTITVRLRESKDVVQVGEVSF